MKNSFLSIVFCLITCSSFAQGLSQTEQSLIKENEVRLFVRINAPLDSVWSRWSSPKGIVKFFAPACDYELKPMTKLGIYFTPTAPKGQRGAEDNLMLAVEEKKMISFTWDAPPMYPQIRSQRTLVTIRFYATSPKETIVTLSQTGWGRSDDWNAVYDYFSKAWGGFVLPNLKYSLEVKAIDWSDFPKSAPQGLKPAERY